MNHNDLNNIYYCMWCGSTFDFHPKDDKCLNCRQKGLRFVTYEMSNPYSTQIIKIQSAEVLESMRNGNLWFQSPRCFQEYKGEGQIARADIHDAKYSYIDKSGYIDNKNVDTYRLLCFYSLDVDEEYNFLRKPDNRLREFGEYYSIIDVMTLLAKIKDHIVSLDKKISYVANWVNYLSQNYSGTYSPFCKFPEYSYQNEFRIVLLSDMFLSIRQAPYITSPPLKNLDEIILKPQSIDGLLSANNLNDL